LKGVAICDSSFAMGCFHSFFGTAIKEHGISIVFKIDSDCAARLGEGGLQCAHGLGHGILSYLGDEKLNEALDVCRKLTWKEPRGGCSSGVIMEYNFHTMQDPVFQQARMFDAKNPYHPCTSVPDFYEEACYFEQAQWFFNVSGESYKNIGLLCEGIENEKNRIACFRGIGGILGPHVEFNTKEILAACKEMPNAASEIYCRQGAAWSFKGEPKAMARSQEPCEGMKDGDLKSCLGGSIERGDKI
jgi:hypothetical protein